MRDHYRWEKRSQISHPYGGPGERDRKGRAWYGFEEAEAAYAAGEYLTARRIAEEALRLDPRLWDAHGLLAQIGDLTRDPRLVVEHLLVLRRANQMATDAGLVLGNALVRLGRHEEAIEAFEDRLRDHRRLPRGTSRDEIRAVVRNVRALAAANTARKKAAAAGPAPKAPAPPDAKAKPASRPPAPRAPVAAAVPVHWEWADGPVETALQEERTAPRADYDLTVEAAVVGLAEGFDTLLALPTLRGVLSLPHQVETARRVLRQFRGRAILADEVGLGKTVEAGMVLKEWVLRGLAHRVLVLVPAGIVGQWRAEMEAKFDLAFRTTEDPAYRADPGAFWASEGGVIASLAAARGERNTAAIRSVAWDAVIVDEAHHLRSRTSASWRLVDGIQSRFLLFLTATPVQNDLDELYNLITLLRPGTLGTPAAFKKRFVSSRDPRVPRDREALRALLAEVLVRNTRAVVDLTLPRRHAETLRVEPGPDEAAFYTDVSTLVRGLYGGVDRLTLQHLAAGAGSSPAAAVSTLDALADRDDIPPAARARAAEVALGARSIGEPRKLARLVDALRVRGESAIVFTRSRATQADLAGRLAGRDIRVHLYHGGMSGPERDLAVGRLRDEGGVLLATESGGEGRNLQFCRFIVNYDLPWNPMRIEQRIGRVHRIGQEREVYVLNLATAGTVEDRLLAVLDEKINLFELVVGELDLILGRLTEDRDFEDLVLDLWAAPGSEAEVDARFQALGNDLARARAAYDETRSLDEAVFGSDFAS